MRKSYGPKTLDKLKKPLLVVAAVVLVIALVFFLVRTFQKEKDDKIYAEKSGESIYSYDYYKFTNAGTVTPSEVDLTDYIPLKDYAKDSTPFYILESTETNKIMLDQIREETYNNQSADYDYYIDNSCYSCDFGDNFNYLFFGRDKSNLKFMLKVSKNWETMEWYVRFDFAVPAVDRSDVEELIVVSKDDAEEYMLNTPSKIDLHRISFDSAIKVTDKDRINTYLNLSRENNFIFGDTLEEIKEAKETSQCGFVFAVFENESVCQCIGAY